WDDALSGQTAYGNIIIRAGHFGFLIGGGRDNLVRDNLIIDSGSAAIHYDSRTYDGFFLDGWYREAVSTENSGQWLTLTGVPYREGIWAEKYPSLAKVTTDFASRDSAAFAVYPAGSVVENNIVIKETDESLVASAMTRTYSLMGENPWYPTAEAAGFDMGSLKFSLQPKGFPEIPVDRIGLIRD
ncbi:MAG: hypothetical protein J6S59_07755, partial [Clostridia bacterium]|nr:hypothetical protein [Clostridia bacterium]